MTSPPDPGALRALRGRAIRAVFFRALLAAFAKEPLGVRGSVHHGGRYNPMGAFGALYCGESRAVCLAEIRKRAAGQPVSPHRLVRSRVALHRVLDLSDPATLAALDLRPEDLVGDDWQRTQRLGSQARAAGFEGLLVPSAAGPGNNLVIFPDRLDARSRVRTAGSPRPFPVPLGP